MGLFIATVKSNRWTNGVKLEKGMSVEFSSNYSDKTMLEITSNPASNIRVLANSCITYHTRKLLKYNGFKWRQKS